MIVINQAKSGKPNYRLILMNYVVPSCDSPTATTIIRKIKLGHNLKQPFIALMSHSGRLVNGGSKDSIADAFSVKPICEETIQSLLNRAEVKKGHRF